LALAGVVISSMSDVVQQGQIGKQQRDAIEASEKQANDEFENLSPEEKQAILDAEAKLRKDAEGSNNNKTIFIGIGILALATIIYFVTKKKK
jgi:LPXTG-motif cell wall-anchored protein